MKPDQEAKKQMSLEEGKNYMSVMGADGEWIITSRGDSGILGKQYVQTIQEEDRTAKPNHGENMLVSTFDSSIAAEEVFAKITQLNLEQEQVDDGEDIEKFAEVDIDPNTGALRNADSIPVHVISEDCGTYSQAQISTKLLGRGARIKFPNRNSACVASRVYAAFVTSLCCVGIALQALD